MEDSFVNEHMGKIGSWYLINMTEIPLFSEKNPVSNTFSYGGILTIVYNHLDKFKATHVIDHYLMNLDEQGAGPLVIDGVSYIVKAEKTTDFFGDPIVIEPSIEKQEEIKKKKEKTPRRQIVKKIKKSTSKPPRMSSIRTVKFKVALYNDNSFIVGSRIVEYTPRIAELYKYFLSIPGNLGNIANKLISVKILDGDKLVVKYTHTKDDFYTPDVVEDNYIYDPEGLTIDINGITYRISTDHGAFKEKNSWWY